MSPFEAIESNREVSIQRNSLPFGRYNKYFHDLTEILKISFMPIKLSSDHLPIISLDLS